MNERDVISIYDLPEEGAEWHGEDITPIPTIKPKSHHRDDDLNDEERLDRMYRKSLSLYEDMLDDPDIPLEKKDKALTRILEVKGLLGKQREEKVYNITFGEDYMNALNVAAEAFIGAE